MSSDACENPPNSSTGEEPTEAKALPTVNFRLEWYQTEPEVVINVLARDVDKDKLKIVFSESQISLNIVFQDGRAGDKTINLFQPVIPEQCKYKVLSSKIEMRVAKRLGLHWASLEKEVEKPLPMKAERNWDKFVKELEEEAQKEEAVLNELFQKIYNEGSDEVKKAMNKSFLESGGTELNTNWDAVSKAKVSVKPPEGMEWKQWDK